MPKGPFGGPRPAVSSSFNITIELNAPDGDVDEMVIQGLTQRFQKVDTMTINTEMETVGGHTFEKVVVDILLEDNSARLIEVNDLVSDMEDALGTRRVGVVMEAV
jgi:hypothetical protein